MNIPLLEATCRDQGPGDDEPLGVTQRSDAERERGTLRAMSDMVSKI